MSRREHAASIKLTTVSGRRPNPANSAVATSVSAQCQAAAEISDVILALRKRSQQHELKFLSYLLEMAFIEAFEQSQMGDRAE